MGGDEPEDNQMLQKKDSTTQSLVKIDNKNGLKNSQTFMQLTKQHVKENFPGPFMDNMPPPPFFYGNQNQQPFLNLMQNG